MSRYFDENENMKSGPVLRDLGIAFIILVILLMGGCPYYNVWEQNLRGQAELARATQNRQIAIQEAQAKEESATHYANAEIERAKGVAKANAIIGDSLKDNEAYLRYLWITEVGTSKDGTTRIYIPTEANIPITEAGK